VARNATVLIKENRLLYKLYGDRRG